MKEKLKKFLFFLGVVRKQIPAHDKVSIVNLSNIEIPLKKFPFSFQSTEIGPNGLGGVNLLVISTLQTVKNK